MKKLVLVLVLALAGWVVYQKVQTGRWSVLPVRLSAEEAEVQRLEAELAEVEGKIAAQERTAGTAGVEAPLSLTELYDRRDALRAKLAAARAKLPK